MLYKRFLLISEIPLVEDPDQDEEENQEDMTLMDEDIPSGYEANSLYVFQVNEETIEKEEGYTSKLIDKLTI